MADSHFEETYSASDLRNAMRYFNIGGRDAIEAIDGIDDFRGDGLESAQVQGASTGDANVHALDRQEADGVAIPGQPLPYKPCYWACCLCEKKCRCCGRLMSSSVCDYRPCSRYRLPQAETTELATQLKGDGCCGNCSRCAMRGDCPIENVGSGALGADFLGLEYVDDEPSQLAQDYFGGDEIAAGEFGESMLASNAMSEDDLIAMGWDPFKAIKKAVRPLTKTVSKAIKTVKRTAGGALKTVGSVAKAGLQLNPYSLLKNPKAAFAAQLNAAKAIVGQVKQTTNLARDLVKSPIIKTVVGGAAIVFPPIGAPAAAMLATAAAVAKAVDSPIGKVAQAAQQVVQNTANLAQRGDAGAQKALSLIATNKQALVAQRLAKPPAGVRRMIFDVNRQGRISRLRA